MTYLGTRPPTLDEFEQYETFYKRRLSIRPGITGMWQATGRSDITDFEEVLALDLEYIDNWSLGLDMQKGLKSFGKQMVEEMNERGMLVDVSHLSDGGFWDCIRLSKKPIIASHSNARALCAHPRNLSDEMLCALGECGGVVGLNFYPQFLQSDRSAEVLDIAKHGMHILQKAGEDSVALGTDFDGFEAGQNWLRGIEEIECVWDALKKAGMTERQLDKLSYQNVKRVLEEVL